MRRVRRSEGIGPDNDGTPDTGGGVTIGGSPETDTPLALRKTRVRIDDPGEDPMNRQRTRESVNDTNHSTLHSHGWQHGGENQDHHGTYSTYYHRDHKDHEIRSYMDGSWTRHDHRGRMTNSGEAHELDNHLKNYGKDESLKEHCGHCIGDRVIWRGGTARLLGDVGGLFSLQLEDGVGTVVHGIRPQEVDEFPRTLHDLLTLADSVVTESAISSRGRLMIDIHENGKLSLLGPDRKLVRVDLPAFYAAYEQMFTRSQLQNTVLLHNFAEWYNSKSRPGDTLMIDLSNGFTSVYNESTGDGYSLGHWGGAPDNPR